MASGQEVLMGYRENYIQKLAPGSKGKLDHEHTRESAIGGRFHLPCLLFVFFLLISPQATAAMPGFPMIPTLAEQSPWKERFSKGTIWQQGCSVSGESAKTADALFEAALLLFPCGTFHSCDVVTKCACVQLSKVDISRICDIPWWAQSRGAPLPFPSTPGTRGLDIQALWCKSPMTKAAARQQRSAAGPESDRLGAQDLRGTCRRRGP